MSSIEPDIAAAEEDAVAAGDLEPVGESPDEQRLFADCDLASLSENRLGRLVDPHHLDATARDDLGERATTERIVTPNARRYERCFWLREDGARVGTIALTSTLYGGRLVRLSSFYVFPAHRSRGTGRRALDRLRRVLGARALGIRLETSWTWQRVVRWYLRAGLWLRMWKRELDLYSPASGLSPIVEIGEQRATISVDVEGERILLEEAARDGARLVWTEREPNRDPRVDDVAWEAMQTLALALALEGWPLVRSAEAWERSYWADGGPPEALAYKITVWEAWERKHGWRVETPRIPGLGYPTWSELEEKWKQSRGAS